MIVTTTGIEISQALPVAPMVPRSETNFVDDDATTDTLASPVENPAGNLTVVAADDAAAAAAGVSWVDLCASDLDFDKTGTMHTDMLVRYGAVAAFSPLLLLWLTIC